MTPNGRRAWRRFANETAQGQPQNFNGSTMPMARFIANRNTLNSAPLFPLDRSPRANACGDHALFQGSWPDGGSAVAALPTTFQHVRLDALIPFTPPQHPAHAAGVANEAMSATDWGERSGLRYCNHERSRRRARAEFYSIRSVSQKPRRTDSLWGAPNHAHSQIPIARRAVACGAWQTARSARSETGRVPPDCVDPQPTDSPGWLSVSWISRAETLLCGTETIRPHNMPPLGVHDGLQTRRLKCASKARPE